MQGASHGYYHSSTATHFMPYPDSNMLSVADVYDAASAIGKDFELIIDRFGVDAVASLMPKVISVLEELEDMAAKHESESKELVDLQRVVDRLETEKVSRQGDRSRFERELEQIEELWRNETQDLLDMVSRLQDENKRLQTELQEAKQGVAEAKSEQQLKRQSSRDIPELQVLTKLKATVEAQRDQIRNLTKEISQKQADIDALQAQSDRLARINAEIRRKHCVSKRQAQHLLESKADLEVQLQAKEQVLKEMKDFVQPEGTASNLNNPGLSASMTEEQLIEKLNSEGKMIIDKADPNRPRFTMCELKEVLMERNELKTKLIEVEEELAVYRHAGDDDAPVQGPINKEPDEKLFPDKRPEIGMKQFFQSLMERIQS